MEVFLNEDDESDKITNEESSDEKTDGEFETTDDIEIGDSNVNQPDTFILEDFEQDIISRIEERTKIAISNINPNLELQKERDEVKKYFDGEAATEESVS